MPRADVAHSYRLRVRYGEVDPQGVVFDARDLDCADVAVTEYWRAIRDADLWAGPPVECHVARATVDFRRPILLDEEIEVMAPPARFGTSSMTTHVAIHGTGDDDLRASVEIVAVHVDLATRRPRPLPEAARDALSASDAKGAR